MFFMFFRWIEWNIDNRPNYKNDYGVGSKEVSGAEDWNVEVI